MNETVLSVQGLKVHYPVRKGFLNFAKRRYLKAVDGVTIELAKGETLGLVGESGCGKSSLGRAIIRLNKPTAGHIQINGIDFLALKGEKLRRARTDIQMIFQDPYGSLDPRMTVNEILSEPLQAHLKLSRKEMDLRIRQALARVSLRDRALKKYPHEFSGGQRQRIAIARALVLEPKILIADEPVSSLDVSVQAEILNLLKEMATIWDFP
ncbi:MAG: dipeptide/oligopeptide/nickel ABC transporter ATP-binding protein [Bdellovibrionota bacterium]